MPAIDSVKGASLKIRRFQSHFLNNGHESLVVEQNLVAAPRISMEISCGERTDTIPDKFSSRASSANRLTRLARHRGNDGTNGDTERRSRFETRSVALRASKRS